MKESPNVFIRVDEQGLVILSDKDVERIAQKVVELLDTRAVHHARALLDARLWLMGAKQFTIVGRNQ